MEKRIIAKQGFLLGKFLPPHAGHVHLVKTAASMVEELWVLVCSIDKEPIPGYLRYEWMKRLFPDLNIVHVAEEVPQSPEESTDFWPIWLDIFSRYGPPEPEVVFSSEKYGDEIAAKMKIMHIMVDMDRKTFPVSGEKVRADPFRYWKYVPEVVRPYFIKRVVLTGPESTGKTVLAEKLAHHFQTTWAEEYVREFWPSLNRRKLELKDISQIASGQLHNEEQAALTADKILFCDTDLISTQIWSEVYFKQCPDWILQINYSRKYDLFLLMDIDIPWEDDGTREFPHLRKQHFDLLKKELDKRRLNYQVISGDFQIRFENAVNAVKKILDT